MALRDTYEWLLGMRYLRSGNKRGFLSFITAISIGGLTLGVAVLVVVLSVMNGFEKELRSRILNVTSHATLMGLDGPLPDWQIVQEQARAMPGVVAAAPYIEVKAMLVAGSRIAGMQLRGVLPEEEAQAVGLGQAMVSGSLDELQADSWRIAIGEALAKELNVTVGDTIVVIAPEGTVTPSGMEPRMRRFTVSGIFRSGMYEYDRGLALVHARDAARLYRLGDAMTGVRLQLSDPLEAPSLVRQLAVDLGGGYYVSDWTRNHANFFSSIRMTKSMLFVILSMIVAIAAFNIVATLVMVVKDKQQDIAILRTFGAGPRNILGVFVVQGTLIGAAGVGLGILLGVVISMNLEALVHGLEALTSVRFLDEKVYFMSDLPASVELGDVLRIGLVALLLGALATAYPAWRASRTAPAEALRHD
ncbi:MAG: lipoprotein-releasing ABC transporter permease subunit [Nevskiaceae bacterium]|jgi:lipoprotein-releasing system permease protein|nr:lipoprotein-releasing ABC transporter permease subunit [Nevskiaceae bacterium]